MSREIKFRGWHSQEKIMFSAEEMAKDQLALLPTGEFANIHSASTKLSTIYPKDKFIPLQFTGLKDKNGKEIYEGDIIYNEDDFSCRTSWGDAADENPDKRIIVFREDGKFDAAYLGEKIRDRGTSGYSFCKANCEKLFEVIGNQFENPDLLK